MTEQRESTMVACARSAIVRFSHIAALRTPSRLFHRLKRDADFSKASPIPGLRKLKGEDGNNLIEYAIVFMFFMSMVLGIVDFSRALYTYHFLSNAAREATRWAAVRGTTCVNDGSCAAPASKTDIQAYVRNITPPGVNPNPPDLTTTPSWSGTDPVCQNDTPSPPGCTVEVEVSYKFKFVVPFIRTTPLTLSSSSEMIIVH
jgi:Flp pilus assembly protein TadG